MIFPENKFLSPLPFSKKDERLRSHAILLLGDRNISLSLEQKERITSNWKEYSNNLYNIAISSLGFPFNIFNYEITNNLHTDLNLSKDIKIIIKNNGEDQQPQVDNYQTLARIPGIQDQLEKDNNALKERKIQDLLKIEDYFKELYGDTRIKLKRRQRLAIPKEIFPDGIFLDDFDRKKKIWSQPSVLSERISPNHYIESQNSDGKRVFSLKSLSFLNNKPQVLRDDLVFEIIVNIPNYFVNIPIQNNLREASRRAFSKIFASLFEQIFHVMILFDLINIFFSKEEGLLTYLNSKDNHHYFLSDTFRNILLYVFDKKTIKEEDDVPSLNKNSAALLFRDKLSCITSKPADGFEDLFIKIKGELNERKAERNKLADLYKYIFPDVSLWMTKTSDFDL